MQAYLDQQQLYNQRRNFRIKLYFGLLLLILIFILIFYILLYSPIFQIREFRIAGNERLSDEDVLKILQPLIFIRKIDNFLGFKNLLVWKMKNPDTSDTPIAEVSIKRDWLRQSIIINIKERGRLAVWCGKKGDYCYWIDREGTAFEEAPQTEGSLILTIQDKDAESVIKGTRIVEDRFAANLVFLLEKIPELRMTIKNVALDKKLQELRVETYSGPDFLFSIRFDPALSLTSLQSLQEKMGFKGIQYVDLRVENRLYYKNL